MLSRANQLGRVATSASTSLDKLIKQRAALEHLLIEMTVVAESLPDKVAKLGRATARIGQSIATVEDRIARKPVRTIGAAIAKLEVYADCQGYDLGARGGRRAARSFEERLFRSVIDDMRRMI